MQVVRPAATVTPARLAPASLKALAAVAATVMLTGSAGAAPAPGPHGRADAGPACRVDLPRVRHLVLFERGTAEDAVRAEITAACGALTGYYAEIAVAVATSTDSTFDDRLGRDRAYSAQAEGLIPAPRRVVAVLPRSVGVQSLPVAAGAADDRSDEQWDMTMIGADQARAVQRGSNGVLVGVLDSGVDGDHPELTATVDRSASAGCVTGVPVQGAQAWRPGGAHGTHVAGIIGAADDGDGVTGVAPGVRIASVKVVDAHGYIYPEYAVCGFMWAARRHMTIANHSYFVDPWLFTCRDVPGQSVAHEALRRAAEHATARGVLSVAAAGNEGLDLADPRVDAGSPSNTRHPQRRSVDDRCDVLPAELPGVLTVSAVGASAVKSSYSSYGEDVVDVAAPGGDLRQRSPAAGSGCVLSTVPGGYGRMCGTSMATPHVAGVAALAASARPSAGPAELAAIVLSSATPLHCPDGTYDPDSDGRADASCTAADAGNSFYGAGLVDAAAAVR